MPRYMVQGTFPEGLHIPVSNGGVAICAEVTDRNCAGRLSVTTTPV